MQRILVHDSLDTNIEQLSETVATCKSNTTKTQLQAILVIARTIKKETTQDAIRQYNKSTNTKPMRPCSIISKYIPVVQLYTNRKAYLLENRGSDLLQLLDTKRKH